MKKERCAHIPAHKNAEERNKEQKHNCPIHSPKQTNH